MKLLTPPYPIKGGGVFKTTPHPKPLHSAVVMCHVKG